MEYYIFNPILFMFRKRKRKNGDVNFLNENVGEWRDIEVVNGERMKDKNDLNCERRE